MKAYSQFLKELPSKKVVFAFGRFQPPTIGHELLVKAVDKLAKEQNASHCIYASKTEDKKSNPLPVSRKVYYLKRMFPEANIKAAGPTTRTLIEVAKELNKKYKNLIMVAGSDRVPEYKRLLEQYNGKDYNFDTIQVVSAGERDPDSDSASGMSGTKMREAAKKGDFASFKKGLPHTLTTVDAKRLMNELREGMGLGVVKEQVKLTTDWLRESYYRGEIYNVGQVVESNGKQYEILSRGSNYLTVVDINGNTSRKWITDVTLVEDYNPKRAEIGQTQVSYKGYKTQNFDTDQQVVAAFNRLTNLPDVDPVAVLNAIKATDLYLGIAKEAEATDSLDDQQEKVFGDNLQRAQEYLVKLGDIQHHQDYIMHTVHTVQQVASKYHTGTFGDAFGEEYIKIKGILEMKFNTSDKIKVARIIADALGIVDVEKSSNAEQLINNSLRKIRNKALRPEYVAIVKKMLSTADDAGIEYDKNLVPKPVTEAKMSDADMAERERIVKGMKKNIASFKSRYGKDAKSVMYATATKQAMKESGGPVVFKNGNNHIEKYGDDSFALYKNGKKSKYYKSIDDAKTAMKEDIEIDEAIKLNTKVKMHAPGKDYHDSVGSVGEIRHGAYKGAPKTYTVDYGNGKSVQLGKQNVKLHKEQVKENPAAKELAKANLAAKHAKEKESLASKHEQEKESIKEEADQIDEISSKLAGNYYGAATKKHIEKVGVKPNMYDRIERDMGKKRKQGVDRALDRVMGARKTNEETNDHHAEAEMHLSKANDSDAKGDKKSFHAHMANHHDSMSEWHDSKGRSASADKHAEKADYHHEKSISEESTYDSALRALDEAMAVIDKGEYDYEGAMARTQLQTTIRNSQELINMLTMDENLPEWVQSKITLAQDYISSVRDYLKSREELGEATAYYNKPSFLKKMSRVAKQERLAREKKEKEAKPIKESEIETSDYKVDKNGKKYKAHKLKVEQAITNPAAGHNDGHQTLKYSDLARLLGIQQPFSAGPEKSNDDLEKYKDQPKDVEDAQKYQSNATSQITTPHMDPAVHGQSHSKRSYGDLKHLIHRKVKYALGEETESEEDDLDDDEFDDEVNSMSEPEHIIDAYDDEELAVVDDDSGEELMGMHEYKDEDEAVKEEFISEAIGRMERIRRAQRFARTKSKREVRTKIALRKTSNMTTINKRARRLAVSMIKKRMLRKDPATASVQEKERIERFLQTRKAIVDRLARRVAPRVRQIEKARLQHKKYTKS
jgi:nicotinic acid mononucleotide adenylyltransferase